MIEVLPDKTSLGVSVEPFARGIGCSGQSLTSFDLSVGGHGRHGYGGDDGDQVGGADDGQRLHCRRRNTAD